LLCLGQFQNLNTEENSTGTEVAFFHHVAELKVVVSHYCLFKGIHLKNIFLHFTDPRKIVFYLVYYAIIFDVT
jgi:hypothetical protein